MTIKLTIDEFKEQFQEADEEELQRDTSDELDIVKKFDAQISQGWWREIYLRPGLELHINKAQHHDFITVNFPEAECRILSTFALSGELQQSVASTTGNIVFPHLVGKYFVRGSGLRPSHICDCSNAEPYSELQILIKPEILHSFTVFPEGELPRNLQHLVRTPDQKVYLGSRDTQPMMDTILQQIVYCPYQGMVKRMYLESKIIELMALVIDQEITIQQGEVKKGRLKPEQIERVHYAKEILLQNLSNPPSLAELAHQVGLNDFLLKQGFRQVFGKPVFGELRSHRLEIAKQLLAEQDISVTEIAHRVGYSSARALARAFRHKFGVGPKAYQKACR